MLAVLVAGCLALGPSAHAGATRPTPAGATPASLDDGRLGLSGRVLRDENGPSLALGATLFWGLWGESHDPARLDRNLAWLAARGVDYVRILGMVGGESWSDRTIDPAASDYWEIVDRFLARLSRHGLRAQVTIFAEAEAMMPEPAARQAFVDRWAAQLERDPERFAFAEIANEYFQNGLELREVRTLGDRLAGRTAVLVAFSAPGEGQACAMYAGSAADLATIHYSREVEKEGPWQPVWQPWEYPDAYDAGCRGRLPVAVNNEPIGPGSSVAEEVDPLRLTMAYVSTFVGQNAAYTLHAGAGIRGGGEGDRSRGRAANFFEVPGLELALTGIRAMRTRLPPDLPNWTRAGPDAKSYPFDGVSGTVAQGRMVRSLAATRANDFVVVMLGLMKPVEVTARRDLMVDVIDPLSGNLLTQLTLRAGETTILSPPRAQLPSGDALLMLSR